MVDACNELIKVSVYGYKLKSCHFNQSKIDKKIINKYEKYN